MSKPNGVASAAQEAQMAIFYARQYLGDPRCQQVMKQLALTWKGRDPAAEALIAPFHPLTADDFKKANEIDVFFLQSIQGDLNRVHVVKKNDVVLTNPRPDDYLCESCRANGWLRKEFQVSKIDGAVVALWVCTNCAKADSADELEPEDEPRQKVGFKELDENPPLFDLMSNALGAAIVEVRQTGTLVPFALIETNLYRIVRGFKADRLEWGYEEARRAILTASAESMRYALAWLGYTTQEGVRYETILVGGGKKGEGRGVLMGQRYKQRPEVNYEPIGNPAILGPHENLLTLSGEPDALLKLPPVFTRLRVDMAHNHGPGRDETLTYELKRCQEVILELGDLDRPFLKELQKRPDVVHVVMGRSSWLAQFRPEDKEVILARDTLVPLKGGQPFPGFKEDGLITIGYLPPESALDAKPTNLQLVVLWMTMFKITDKE